MYAMKTVVATLLTANDLHLASPGEIRPARRNISLGPEGGVEMVRKGAPVRQCDCQVPTLTGFDRRLALRLR
jgi:hypothetical protein